METSMEKKSKEEVLREVEATRANAKFALKDAGEVWSGRNAVAHTWRSTKDKYHRAQEQISESAHAADDTIRHNIYSTLGIAAAIGALAGFLFTGKSKRKKSDRC